MNAKSSDKPKQPNLVPAYPSTYDPLFIAKILEGRREIEDGKGVKIDIANLWK